MEISHLYRAPIKGERSSKTRNTTKDRKWQVLKNKKEKTRQKHFG